MNSASLSLRRTAISLGSGVLISLSLFYVMVLLVSGGQKLKPSSDSENFIDFVRIQRPSNLETRKRELPKKPEVREQDMPKEKFNVVQENKPSKPNLKFNTPALDIPLALGPGGMAIAGSSGMGQGGASGDSDETPLVRVEPQYPAEASLKGIESGWVRVHFDLGADGSVENARAIQSSHRNLFETAAIKAILKWKYRPKLVDGKAVPRKNLKVHLDFSVN